MGGDVARKFRIILFAVTAIVILLIGLALVLISAPQMKPDVLTSGWMSADESHNKVKSGFEVRGPYSVWIEDYRPEDEFDFYRVSLIGEDGSVRVFDEPPERKTWEFDGVEYELLAILEDGHTGIHSLEIDLKEEATPGPERYVTVLIVTSPGIDAMAILVVGILLLIVGGLMSVWVIKVVYLHWMKMDVE